MTLIININTKRTNIPSSALLSIGEHIEKLAQDFQNDDITPNDSVPAINLSINGTGKQEVEGIAAAMSISRVAKVDSDSWEHKETVFGATPADLLSKNINVKFVFESANETILVVRDAEALEYGKHTGTVPDVSGGGLQDIQQSPPMKEGEYIQKVPEVRDFILKLLSDAVRPISDTATKDEVVQAIKNHIDAKVPPLDSDGAKKVFYEQLGAYSVRQCS